MSGDGSKCGLGLFKTWAIFKLVFYLFVCFLAMCVYVYVPVCVFVRSMKWTATANDVQIDARPSFLVAPMLWARQTRRVNLCSDPAIWRSRKSCGEAEQQSGHYMLKRSEESHPRGLFIAHPTSTGGNKGESD